MRHDINRNKEQIIKDYKNGTSINELTQKYDTSYTTIKGRLLKWIPIQEIKQIQEQNREKRQQERIMKIGENSTSGYYRVYKAKSNSCRQGYVYIYGYLDEEGTKKRISRVDIQELEIAVKEQGLPWVDFNE